ncbi:MAG: tyrosine-type recombinase/integrase [Thermincola sp.]|jgi:site-specific recombinase XerD|nr:tyrosine-type recombinase/integrase [Thermincola sp.]MDT3703286.1 tyrosine-type recombinase/integrase [Thermincola sp.]
MMRRNVQKVKTTGELKKCDSYDLDKMMDGFLLEQSCRGNSPATMVFYKENITKFIEYFEDQELELSTASITKEEIKKYILHLKSSKKWTKADHIKCNDTLSSKSIQTYLRAIKAWIRWMAEEGYVDSEVATSIKLPKAARNVIEILSDEEIEEIYKHLNTKANNRLRDLLIFLTLLECGLRLEELTKLKLSNVRVKQNILKVLGKGNKERFVSFGVNLNKLFFKYGPGAA